MKKIDWKDVPGKLITDRINWFVEKYPLKDVLSMSPDASTIYLCSSSFKEAFDQKKQQKGRGIVWENEHRNSIWTNQNDQRHHRS